MISIFRKLLVLCAMFPALVFSQDIIHHDLKTIISPDKHTIHVTDKITFPNKTRYTAGEEFAFLVHAGEVLKSLSDQVVIQKASAAIAKKYFPDVVANSYKIGGVNVDIYSVRLPDDISEFSVEYDRKINYSIEQRGAEYERSMSESAGVIDNKGVYLANESFWYPYFGDELVTFELSVQLPGSWKSVSQGERIRSASQSGLHLDIWKENNPQDDIYLVAAQFTEYEQSIGATSAMAFLRTKDDALAQKYLDTTAQYMEMYRKLLGPFPYSKFALVENFWETGYGMPSFTLLGPRIIRFPFILHSSYPHELLHNWWGNSVYVDYEKGNWAEGLTAYLADHLIKEQRGQGGKHRRATLQKYTNYAKENNDFSLSRFVSRHNAVTEAVGYGKTLMFFHMLRQKLGDEVFAVSLKRFYMKYRFSVASFDDIKDVFSKTANQNLDSFFNQWVSRVGAPDLKLNNAQVKKQNNGKYRLTAEVRQMQQGDVYQLELPVAIMFDGSEDVAQKKLAMNHRVLKINLEFDRQPAAISVDPEFDLFRRLDLYETPPVLSQMFGAESALIILPSKASPEMKKSYQALASSWKNSRDTRIDIVFDQALKKIPDDRAVWLFGWENKFREVLSDTLTGYNSKANQQGIRISGANLSADSSSIILVSRNPDKPEQSIALVSSDNSAAIPGLGRKLPHYGKYSYLAFEGAAPDNHFKGQWPIVASPLQVALRDNYSTLAKLKPRTALAQLSPVFSEKDLFSHVKVLASGEMQGRGLGSKSLDEAAEYIASKFNEYGLQSLTKDTNYFQTWEEDIAGLNKAVTLKNVVGVLPGKNPKYSGESVVVSAHYDHLGLGWPDVRKGNEGKVHFGADDNASGVSVMLELAKIMSKSRQNERAIIFVAFTGEEANRIGSQYFIKHSGAYPSQKMIGAVNLDTVGRLGKNPLTVFGTGSATEWVHIFRGAGFVTGINVKSVAKDFGSSDQKSFHDVNVPAVQFFSGVNEDFHKPSDKVEKIDSAGLVKVAAILKETVDYLSVRETSLTNTMIANKGSRDKRPQSGRKVSLGTVPDFTYQGQGVLVSDVVPNSPAEKSGIQQNDVIVGINSQSIDDLRGFASALRNLNPGEKILLDVERNKQKIKIKAYVSAR